MANPKKFLGQIDLNKIPVKNIVAEQLASAPATPVEGQLYQNTTDHKLYRYNGTSWVECSAATSIDASIIGAGSVSNTEFGYLDGVTSPIQTQLGTKTTKYSVTFGNGSDKTYTITHNLGTKDVFVSVRLVADDAMVDGFYIVNATTNTVTIEMETAPGVDALRAVVIG